MKRGKKIALWSGGVVVTLIVAVLVAVSWVLFTTSGARWVAGLATSRFAPMVKYARIDGTIAGELTITDFRFEGGPTVAKIRIARMTVDPTLRMLFSRVLRIERASVEGLVLTLPEQEKPDEPDEPLWVEPPLEVVVKDFALRDGRVIKANEKLFSVRQLGIAARWSREAIDIERLELLPGDIEGDLSVKGRITPAGRTLRGELDAKWKNVVIPASLAGRKLASAGALHIDGTPEKYLAKGELDVGPPGDLIHAVVDVVGYRRACGAAHLGVAPARRPLRRERNGGVRAGGLESHGRRARLQSRSLAGRMARTHQSRADVARRSRGSGAARQREHRTSRWNAARPADRGRRRSRLRRAGYVERRTRSAARAGAASPCAATAMGRSGIDANVELAVASLNDWLPDTAGSLAGNFRVRGSWPKLTIAGTANGKSLAVADAKVAALRVEATVATPLDPSGNVKAEAKQVSAAGFEFARVSLSADGNQANHRLALDADGERLDVTLALSGELDRVRSTPAPGAPSCRNSRCARPTCRSSRCARRRASSSTAARSRSPRPVSWTMPARHCARRPGCRPTARYRRVIRSRRCRWAWRMRSRRRRCRASCAASWRGAAP